MAKEFPQPLQDLPVCAHKQNSSIIFATYHRSSYVSLQIKSNPVV